jgi:hypothetical protein
MQEGVQEDLFERGGSFADFHAIPHQDDPQRRKKDNGAEYEKSKGSGEGMMAYTDAIFVAPRSTLSRRDIHRADTISVYPILDPTDCCGEIRTFVSQNPVFEIIGSVFLEELILDRRIGRG